MSTIILETERLRLRGWGFSDLRPMAAISADPRVMEYFPAALSFWQSFQMFRRIQKHYRKHGYCLYATELKSTGEMIGFVGLNAPGFSIPGFTPKSMPIMEIGWRLAASHWGKGYATEAAKAVLQHAFTELGLEEIISFTSKLNTPSMRVMEKIGLQHNPEDDFDHPNLAWNNPLFPHVLYRLERSQWVSRAR